MRHSFEPITYSNQGPLYNRLLVMFLEYLNGRLRLEHGYKKALADYNARRESGVDYYVPFFDVALEHLNIRLEVTGEIGQIPSAGPLIVFANHPFGILDGLISASLIHRQRQDFRILANHALQKAEPMRQWLLPLDDSGTRKAESLNRPAIIRAMRHLGRENACLCIFPAGRVARPAKWGAAVEDYTWQEFAGRMVASALKTGLDLRVLPLYFDGRNSGLFHAAHLFQMPPLRRALIMAELLKKKGAVIRIHIGQPIPATRFLKCHTSREITQSMRQMLFSLQPAPILFPRPFLRERTPAQHRHGSISRPE